MLEQLSKQTFCLIKHARLRYSSFVDRKLQGLPVISEALTMANTSLTSFIFHGNDDRVAARSENL